MAALPTQIEAHIDGPLGPAADSAGRSWMVGIGVVLSFILFFAFVTLLAVRWVGVHVPTAVVEIVDIPQALDGATLRIEGFLLPKPLEYPITPKLRGTDNLIRVYLDGGRYRLLILQKGNELFSAPLDVTDRGGVRFDMKRLNLSATASEPAS